MSLIAKINDASLPPPIIAEMSGNHAKRFEVAKQIVSLAAENGAAAIKLQTYTPETLTVPRTDGIFIQKRGLWKGRTLHVLYSEASTPYDWHKPLGKLAQSLGIPLFSSPFDESAVDFLEADIDPECYKISSFEITHLPLLAKVALTGKPVILSTGMANEEEIRTAIDTLQSNGCPQVVALKCVSAYPSSPDSFNLKSMISIQEQFDVVVGLSDHTLGNEVAIAATALGARIIEKHFTNDRAAGGIDADFSLEPGELKSLVNQVGITHSSLGLDEIGPTDQDRDQLKMRPSIYVSRDIAKGEILDTGNLKIARPALGLSPGHWSTVMGKAATRDLRAYDALQEGDFE